MQNVHREYQASMVLETLFDKYYSDDLWKGEMERKLQLKYKVMSQDETLKIHKRFETRWRCIKVVGVTKKIHSRHQFSEHQYKILMLIQQIQKKVKFLQLVVMIRSQYGNVYS